MNIHIVAEGQVGEKALYRHWVPLVNPQLTYVNHITETLKNNFSIVIGGGYPHYLDIIDASIMDVNCMDTIDRLVIAVDSEEMSYDDKYKEIQQHVLRVSCRAEIKIVIQHFCMETWALGNRAIINPQTQSTKLRSYLKSYDVRFKDPEMLTPGQNEDMNRAQYAERYLKYALNDKYKQLSYSKHNPQALLHFKYFQRVKQRLNDTQHIKSFQSFLEAFNP